MAYDQRVPVAGVSVRAGALREGLRDHVAQVRFLHRPRELHALERAWERILPPQGATPMQEPMWNLSCAEALLGHARLTVVTVEDQSGLRALVPLLRTPTFPRGYEQLGVGPLHEPTDLIYADTEALGMLLEALAKSGRPLVLGRVPAEGPTPRLTKEIFRDRALVLVRPCSNLPYIGLQRGREAEDLLTKSMLSDLRRRARKAEAMGRVRFAVHAPSTEKDFLPLFESALSIESASWKGQFGSDLASDDRRLDFFRRYGIRAAESGSLRLAFMYIDDRAVAMQIAVVMNGGFWLLKIGYDPAFSKCSPGQLLILETLRYAKQQGLESYEFLGSSEDWTLRWTKTERQSVRIEIYPYTLSGMSAVARLLAGGAWRRTRRYLRRPH